MMRQYSLAKNQANYENEKPKETHKHEQKPIKNFNEFSDSEEQEFKNHAEKRLADRREKAKTKLGRKQSQRR